MFRLSETIAKIRASSLELKRVGRNSASVLRPVSRNGGIRFAIPPYALLAIPPYGLLMNRRIPPHGKRYRERQYHPDNGDGGQQEMENAIHHRGGSIKSAEQ